LFVRLVQKQIGTRGVKTITAKREMIPRAETAGAVVRGRMRRSPYTNRPISSIKCTPHKKRIIRPKTAPTLKKLSLDVSEYPKWLTRTFFRNNLTQEEKKRAAKERRERRFQIRNIQRPRTAPATKKRTGLRARRKRGLTAASSQLKPCKKYEHLFSLTLKDLRMRRHVPKMDVKLSQRTLANAIRAGIPKRTIVKALEDDIALMTVNPSLQWDNKTNSKNMKTFRNAVSPIQAVKLHRKRILCDVLFNTRSVLRRAICIVTAPLNEDRGIEEVEKCMCFTCLPLSFSLCTHKHTHTHRYNSKTS